MRRKTTHNIILIIANILFFTVLSAQNVNQKGIIQNILDTSKIIIVSGESEIIFEPDYYKVEIEITDKYCKRDENIEMIVEKAKKILKSNKISLDSLKLINIKKGREFTGNVDEEVIERRKYSLTVYSKKIYEDLKEEFRINISGSFYLKDYKCNKVDVYKKSLYEKALKDAEKKAKVLSKLLSQEIETVLSVKESGFQSNDMGYEQYSGISLPDDFSYKLELSLTVIYKIK